MTGQTDLALLTPAEAGLEASHAMLDLLRELRAVYTMADDDPRRVAAIMQKEYVLALIARSGERAS